MIAAGGEILPTLAETASTLPAVRAYAQPRFAVVVVVAVVTRLTRAVPRSARFPVGAIA